MALIDDIRADAEAALRALPNLRDDAVAEALGEAAEDADNLAVHLLRTEAKVGAR